MAAPKKKVKIEEKKLGRRRYQGHQIWGWADGKKKLIQVEKTAKGKRKLGIYVHEGCHIALPEEELSEEDVLKIERVVTDVLWRAGYRNINERN